ncbi:MBL fold metallo-hydrolase [Myroides guanonis]|uniref:Phosphoribosyl 1,2-cyclic phosphate phosphodiesterase n=1 Tax=Myroides guanonis TaxID=1150112 RepID=A0A1I3RU75_9FLAO|nr:MBL fold metallo-hydrolase [Myroides guanonis]SFJ49905.1 phosphoribosyl 1,2-cyclic phosphate phosphodiesterase [Myroides guanonis]
MKVYFLGTGTSQGIPVIGSNHPVGKSMDIRDKRLRTSVLIYGDDYTYLIDCGPDFRQQMLISKCTEIDAILFTHEHADHIAGLDDIRPFCFRQGSMPIFGLSRVLDALTQRYAYIFATENRYPGAPSVIPFEISSKEVFTITNQSIIPISVQHGDIDILGYRFDDLVYLTDVKWIHDDEIVKIIGAKVLIVNCLRVSPHPTHFNLEETLAFIDKVKPQKTYLIHISQDLGFHEEVQKELPDNVYLAFDNLVVDI